MSIAGGLENAFQAGVDAGCDCLQIFVKNQRQWRARPLTEDVVTRFRQAARRTGIRPVVAHATYLINLASPDDTRWHQSIDALTEELLRCEALGVRWLVVHPGAHLGEGVEAGLARITMALDKIHRRTAGIRARLLLETTAGQGTTLGAEFTHFRWIMDAVREPRRLRVCLDTCHLFAAGYDLRRPVGYERMVAELVEHVGLSNVACIHVNDSKGACGSRLDRHEHIGRGRIGRAGFALLVNDPRFVAVPKILETPKGTDARGLDLDRVNLQRLRGLIRRKTVAQS
jgi:deoxyribonuclease-4